MAERVDLAAQALRSALGIDSVDAVVVLGSGLGSYAQRHEPLASVRYGDVPGFPVPKAIDHAGTAHVIELAGRSLLLLAGRAHAYEGHDMETVVRPVRAGIAVGAGTVVLTNASGGIADHLSPGDLVVVADHINTTGRNPLVGPNDDRLGVRFPDMTDVYSPELRVRARRIAGETDMTLPDVVYAWWLGPSFETPAEIRMLRSLGADVVGMSTVPEVIAARHMGARVVAFSLVTNRAAGLSDRPLSADEVIEVAESVRPKVEVFLDRFLTASD